MTDFYFDIAPYVIMQHRDTNVYYAIDKNIWKNKFDNCQDINDSILTAIKLIENFDTKKLHLSDVIDEVKYIDLKGVLIKVLD